MWIYHPSIFQLVAITSLPFIVSAHTRWTCPEPRSSYADITRGPCGDDTDNFDDSFLAMAGDGSVLEIRPGPLRVTFEEALSHTGAPFRISLSGECANCAGLGCSRPYVPQLMFHLVIDAQ